MTASHAFRSFRRRPAFTAAALVVSLAALGLFATGGLRPEPAPVAASATRALPLPAPQPTRLVDTMPLAGLPAPIDTPDAPRPAAAAPVAASVPDSAVVEPVDPAAALFGDQALVGAAN
jgi:hypothetical protein